MFWAIPQKTFTEHLDKKLKISYICTQSLVLSLSFATAHLRSLAEKFLEKAKTYLESGLIL